MRLFFVQFTMDLAAFEALIHDPPIEDLLFAYNLLQTQKRIIAEQEGLLLQNPALRRLVLEQEQRPQALDVDTLHLDALHLGDDDGNDVVDDAVDVNVENEGDGDDDDDDDAMESGEDDDDNDNDDDGRFYCEVEGCGANYSSFPGLSRHRTAWHALIAMHHSNRKRAYGRTFNFIAETDPDQFKFTRPILELSFASGRHSVKW